MKVDGITSRRRLVLVAASSVVLALGAAACGGSGAQMSGSSEVGVAVTDGSGGPTDPTTVPPTVTVIGATTDPATTAASATTNQPAPTAAPASSAPATTSGLTWVTIKPPLVSIISIPPILFTPTVTSLSVSGTVGCFSGLTPVSWTTSNASGVNIEVDGAMVVSGYPSNGSININIPGRGCSQTHTVKVTALYANGTAGGSKSASVYVNWF